MDENKDLGRLENVDLNEVWNHEAHEFTPWLAHEENLALLGDTIGIDLELEAQEKNVGPFRADILCKDTGSNNWVLIENQLERTDHTHLGQLMTYAAGLKAVTIVWIARRFTEEHRAAMDWLNDITDDRFNFFGLEIELWKIGTSAMAPKFNMVCSPNDWIKKPPTPPSGELTETQQAQLAFWRELRSVMSNRGGVVKPVKAQPWSSLSFSIGRSGFCLLPSMHTRKHRVTVALQCYDENAKKYFALLEQERAAIEEEIDAELEWSEMPGKKRSYISLRWNGIDPLDRTQWPKPQEWIAERLEQFHKCFAPRVKELNAGDCESMDGD
jgi:hypothetical protein